MKKTFLAMVMAGGCLTMFAQTTPLRTTTSQSTTNNSVTNSTSDPVNSVTNTQVNSTTNNGINASTSWAPVGSPNWGWNNYGIWNQRTNLNTTTYPSSYRTDASNINNTSVPQGTTNLGTITTGTSNTYNSAAGSTSTAPLTGTSNSTMNPGGGLNSTGAYDAYSTPQENYGKPITSAPMNVQSNFGKEYPTTTSQTYTWNQYDDWYQTQYIDKGRLTQYYYDQKGTGYSLSLPVLQTYVPEEIVDKALQKYGSGLYSISMIKAADGTPAYSIGLIQHGGLQMVHLKDDGSSVAGIWRVEAPVTDGMMNTTDANAAMDTQGSMATDATIADDANMKKEEKATKKAKWDDKKMKNKQKKVDD